MIIPSFRPLKTLPLAHSGDCSLLGVSPDHTIYVEEVYSEDGWLAQHALTLEGERLASVDEEGGTKTDLRPLTLPPDLIKPTAGWQTMMLNFTGPRHRGMRGPERLPDLLRTLPIQDKINAVQMRGLPFGAMQILGLAESYVLSEAELVRPHVFVVCRRVRLAYALAEEQRDETDQPYDYDTHVLYTAHVYDREAEAEPTLTDILSGFPGVALERPMDCLIHADRLFIAEGGAGERRAAVHVWQIEGGPSADGADGLQRKIYG